MGGNFDNRWYSRKQLLLLGMSFFASICNISLFVLGGGSLLLWWEENKHSFHFFSGLKGQREHKCCCCCEKMMNCCQQSLFAPMLFRLLRYCLVIKTQQLLLWKDHIHNSSSSNVNNPLIYLMQYIFSFGNLPASARCRWVYIRKIRLMCQKLDF